ncbi:MAG: multicopper oxidase domain-containing protein [Flavobacteriaceae bacterium]
MKKIYLLITGIITSLFSYSQNQLFIPTTITGTSVNLTIQDSSVQFYTGAITNTIGINGSILGPTLVLNQGDFVNFSVNNQLTESTTIHWHGLHVAPQNDGGPHTVINANSTWSPSFTILDKASTYWYHPHLHKYTDKHVSKGAAGLIIVKDSIEATLNLPRNYGVDDFPLVIQTKDFDASNQIMVHTNSDNIPMVNATIDPYLNVPSQVVRYRVLNGSSQRAFNLGLTNNQTFYQIASDGGLLPSPVSLTRLLLAPGERAEILVDFSGKNGQAIYLKSFASELPNGIYGATNPGMGAGMSLTGYNPNPLNGADFNLVKFIVGAQTSSPITTITSSLVTVNRIVESTSNITRTLTFSPASMGMNQLNGNFLINNTSFDHSVINYTIPFNNTEIWSLTNQSGIAHPFHIHDVQFNILTRNGVVPAANEMGRKDVVLVKPQETVRFIAKFETFANDTLPYMYHCHLLSHEDSGMMGQFVVSENMVDISEKNMNNEINVFPNPSNGIIYIQLKNNEVELNNILIINSLGELVYADITLDRGLIRLSGLKSGVYYIRVYQEGKQITKKLLVL